MSAKTRMVVLRYIRNHGPIPEVALLLGVRDELLQDGLVQKVPAGHYYVLTDRGNTVLDKEQS